MRVTVTFNFPFNPGHFGQFIDGGNLFVSLPRATFMAKEGGEEYYLRAVRGPVQQEGNNSATIVERKNEREKKRENDDLLSRLRHVAIYKLTFRSRVHLEAII